MIQSQAHTALRELRADIARRGYDTCDKRHLAVIFNDILLAYSSGTNPAFDPAKRDEIKALEAKWQKDRRNETGGADTIAYILAEIEKHIPVLAAEYKSTVITIPTAAEQEADRVLEVLRQRGATISV